MAPPKKRKNITGDRQLNIKKFFCQTPEPRKIDEGRVTEATPEKMTGAGETEERGADCSGEGGCSRTVTAPDTGPTADPCPAGDRGPRPTGNVDPAKKIQLNTEHLAGILNGLKTITTAFGCTTLPMVSLQLVAYISAVIEELLSLSLSLFGKQ